MTATNSKGSDKRKTERYPIGITMDILAQGASVGKCRGTIVDLSTSGMSFKSNAMLEEGMTLHLKLNIPLEIRGEIRHRKNSASGMHRYGVRFHKIGYTLPEVQKPQKFIAAKFQTSLTKAN